MKVRLEGAQRSCSPEETIERMRPFYRDAGITRISDITGLDCSGIHVSQCIRPDAVYLSVDSGKGATKQAARASAMMEGFERHVGETAIVSGFKASGVDLEGAETRFQLFKGAFYNPEKEREWATAKGLFGENAFVPVEVVKLMPRQTAFPLFHSCFASTSNGLSSGNTLHEALAGGLYEVIERDQVSAAMGLKSVPRVDLDSVSDDTLSGLINLLRKNGIFPVIFDCTGDIGVPTYTAYLYDSERNTGLYRGYASHLDPIVAQCRAVCEAVQGRVVWMSGARDDISSELFFKTKKNDTAENIASLLAGDNTVSSNLRADESTDTFSGDIKVLSKKLQASGFTSALYTEFEHPYPCSVVRVMVPGLSGYMHVYGEKGRRR